MKKLAIFLLLILSGCSYSPAPSDPKTNIKYITADKVIVQECGKSPCNFILSRTLPDGKKLSYKSVPKLNPETQTFQSKFYTTSVYINEGMNGITKLGKEDYLTVESASGDYTVDNISNKYLEDFNEIYYSSRSAFLAQIILLPLFGLFAMALIIYLPLRLFVGKENFYPRVVEIMKSPFQPLIPPFKFGREEGRKLLDEIDKDIREKRKRR